MYHEKIERAAGHLMLMCVALVALGCAMGNTQQRPVVLTDELTLLEGWLSVGGEWKVFQTKRFADYYPYDNKEEMKCVSVLNRTGKIDSFFRKFDGKEVVLSGFTRKYDELSKGNSVSDVLLSKRYFDNEVVPNFCLRSYVFIATDVRRK